MMDLKKKNKPNINLHSNLLKMSKGVYTVSTQGVFQVSQIFLFK